MPCLLPEALSSGAARGIRRRVVAESVREPMLKERRLRVAVRQVRPQPRETVFERAHEVGWGLVGRQGIHLEPSCLIAQRVMRVQLSFTLQKDLLRCAHRCLASGDLPRPHGRRARHGARRRAARYEARASATTTEPSGPLVDAGDPSLLDGGTRGGWQRVCRVAARARRLRRTQDALTPRRGTSPPVEHEVARRRRHAARAGALEALLRLQRGLPLVTAGIHLRVRDGDLVATPYRADRVEPPRASSERGDGRGRAAVVEVAAYLGVQAAAVLQARHVCDRVRVGVHAAHRLRKAVERHPHVRWHDLIDLRGDSLEHAPALGRCVRVVLDQRLNVGKRPWVGRGAVHEAHEETQPSHSLLERGVAALDDGLQHVTFGGVHRSPITCARC